MSSQTETIDAKINEWVAELDIRLVETLGDRKPVIKQWLIEKLKELDELAEQEICAAIDAWWDERKKNIYGNRQTEESGPGDTAA